MDKDPALAGSLFRVVSYFPQPPARRPYVIVTMGINTDGRREVLGMDVGPSKAETFWTEFLRRLRRRGLQAVKLVVSDAHEGIKAAIAKLLSGSWQRCRMHTMRNALAHAGRKYGYHQSLSLSGPKRSATIDRSQE
jgi:transposase-like protein